MRDVEITVDELNRCLNQARVRNPLMPNRVPLTSLEKCRYLQLAMFGAFYPNYFVRHYSATDLQEVNRALNGRNPMRSVYLSNFPQQQAPYGELYAKDIKKIFEVSCE